MDNADQIPSQESTNNIPSQTPNPVVEPQQTIATTTKSKKLWLIIVIILLVLGAAAAAWFVFVKKDKQNIPVQQTANNNQTSRVSESSEKCAYIPKQNYQENEGLYGIWRERAKNMDFDVYLPCSMFKDFNVAELGISDENGGQVFLRFNRPEPEEGDDNLQDDTWFYVVQAQSVKGGCATGCTKTGDTKFGSVLKDNQGDLYLTVGNSLIKWSFPPYDDSGDMKPMLDILNSLQKVDPQKLEFFNG